MVNIRKPVKRHLQDGTFRADRHKIALLDYMETLPSLPEWYSDEAKEIFTIFATYLNNLQILSNAFLFQAAALATWLARHYECEKKLAALPIEALIVNVSNDSAANKQYQIHPLQRLSWKYFEAAMKIAKELCITPATFQGIMNNRPDVKKDALTDIIEM